MALIFQRIKTKKKSFVFPKNSELGQSARWQSNNTRSEVTKSFYQIKKEKEEEEDEKKRCSIALLYVHLKEA